jgi:hypothetical protein
MVLDVSAADEATVLAAMTTCADLRRRPGTPGPVAGSILVVRGRAAAVGLKGWAECGCFFGGIGA